MKKLLFLFSFSLFLSFQVSAQMQDALALAYSIEEVNENEKNDVLAAAAGIKFKPYRKIKVRPRDNKECDCHSCFGVCKMEVSVDIKDITDIIFGLSTSTNTDDDALGYLDFDRSGKSATLYFLSNVEHAETEFIVDEDLTGSNPSSRETVTILKGNYDFSFERETLVLEGKRIPTYGKVVLNVR